MYPLLSSSLPLGIDWVKILLHLLNFALLMTGLTFLLYKPVLKFIKNRQSTIKNRLDEIETEKAKAEETIKEYQTRLDAAETEIGRKKAEAEKEIEQRKEALIAEAKARADEIYRKAQAESENERIEAINNLHNEIADVAITIAENILEREISREENARIIDSCLKEWSDDD